MSGAKTTERAGQTTRDEAPQDGAMQDVAAQDEAGQGDAGQGEDASTTVHLLGGPRVSVGAEELHIPPSSQRLMCFVALRPGPNERSFVAGTLWPDGDDTKAGQCLRSALFRLHKARVFVIDADKWRLCLAAGVRVDVADIAAWADGAINATSDARVEFPPDLPHDVFDLLPGFGDPWIVAERERLRQRVLHALEARARRLLDLERYADAIDAVLPAVVHEPLRETARAILVDAYAGQGNIAQAQATFDDFVSLLRRELGVNPSNHLRAQMVRALGSTTLRNRPVKFTSRLRPRRP